ncbi:MAG: desulfoferrodoxin [Deltaproteobacteria bacterium]|nr:desulfoferrodoxin [Deltaproteobacteria bacterium]
MTKKSDIYKCEECGNIVEVLHEGKCDPECCGKTMKVFEANTTDAAKEKHVPVITKNGDKVVITVGSTLHPMDEDHYIEWIELIVDDKTLRQDLSPGGEPMAVFKCLASTGIIVRAYCNLHGLWQSEL